MFSAHVEQHPKFHQLTSQILHSISDQPHLKPGRKKPNVIHFRGIICSNKDSTAKLHGKQKKRKRKRYNKCKEWIKIYSSLCIAKWMEEVEIVLCSKKFQFFVMYNVNDMQTLESLDLYITLEQSNQTLCKVSITIL